MPLTADSRAIVKANIAMVRQAERQVRQALEQDPDSSTLRSLLASAQNQQRALRALL
jgi:cytochrome c-type biogenesis protein CcmH/NrfG